MLVCTLGDLLLDVIVRLDTRLAPGDDAVAATTLAPGGQAANVAAWATELGASARIVAVRADDDAGAIVRRELESRRVDIRGPRGERTGVVVSLVQPDGDRTMASDRASAPDLRAEDVEPSGSSAMRCISPATRCSAARSRKPRSGPPRSRTSRARASASTSPPGRTSNGSACRCATLSRR